MKYAGAVPFTVMTAPLLSKCCILCTESQPRSTYRPQRSCEGYVFTGVCLSTGGVWYPSMPCSRSPGGWYPSMPCSRSPGGVPAPREGACSGGSAPGGCLLPGGACSRGVPAGQGGVWKRPPGQQMATVADGTHPTGMHSCYSIKLQ